MTNQNPFSPSFMIDVLLLGEILVDRIWDEATTTTTDYFGGSPANIALNLNLLGFSSKIYGSVGNDPSGDFLIQHLNQNHVAHHVERFDTPTTMVYINKSTQSPIPKFFRHSDALIHFSPELKADIEVSKILHFSFWPLSVTPARDTILQVIVEAKKRDCMIGFDPNYHPGLDDFTQHGLQVLKSILQHVDIIKPSLDDAMRIFGEGHTEREYIHMFQNLGCRLVIMTLGAKGLIASDGQSEYVFPSFARKVIDSTGAGDAFWSGLYAGFLLNKDLSTSIKLGLECSARSLEVVGANAHLPNIQILMESIRSR